MKSNGPSNHPRNRVCVFDFTVSCWLGFVGWCMSGFVEVKTDELTGLALDWAMSDAEGLKNKRIVDDEFCDKRVLIINHGQRKPLSAGRRYTSVETTLSWFGLVKETREILIGWEYEPTQCWANLREYKVSLTAPKHEGEEWAAHIDGISMSGNDIGPAVCRAIVAAKLGGVVMVPADLVGIK